MILQEPTYVQTTLFRNTTPYISIRLKMWLQRHKYWWLVSKTSCFKLTISKSTYKCPSDQHKNFCSAHPSPIYRWSCHGSSVLSWAFPTNILQLLLEDPKGFAVQMENKISPASSGSITASHPQWVRPVSQDTIRRIFVLHQYKIAMCEIYFYKYQLFQRWYIDV